MVAGLAGVVASSAIAYGIGTGPSTFVQSIYIRFRKGTGDGPGRRITIER